MALWGAEVGIARPLENKYKDADLLATLIVIPGGVDESEVKECEKLSDKTFS